ncbi:MAG: hypothetical protein ACE5OY_06410 [Candidatus Bathyarchaeia archaeon]
MKCQVCGRLITGEYVSRKTCCVNKLYVFCSEKCLQEWTRAWMRNQMPMRTATHTTLSSVGSVRRTNVRRALVV